jgi:hypothetical protein
LIVDRLDLQQMAGLVPAINIFGLAAPGDGDDHEFQFNQ